MNRQYVNSRNLISEMRLMLNTKPRKQGLLEGLVYGEDGEEMMNDGGKPQMGPSEQPGMGQDMNDFGQSDGMEQQGMRQRGAQMGETNPLDEDPEIAQLITGIRVQTLQGLTKLAENPESAQYELLKKIFLLVDKAVEDKVDPEK